MRLQLLRGGQPHSWVSKLAQISESNLVVVSPLDLARICSRVLNGFAAEKLGAEFNVSLEPRRLRQLNNIMRLVQIGLVNFSPCDFQIYSGLVVMVRWGWADSFLQNNLLIQTFFSAGNHRIRMHQVFGAQVKNPQIRFWRIDIIWILSLNLLLRHHSVASREFEENIVIGNLGYQSLSSIELDWMLVCLLKRCLWCMHRRCKLVTLQDLAIC